MGETEHRAELDARVEFSNGGHLEVAGFRVDVPSAQVSPAEAGELLVASLGLLMTERVDVAHLRVFPEQHKGTRGGPSSGPAGAGSGGGGTRQVELSHVIHAGMTTYPGLPGPEISPHLTREASRSVHGTEPAVDRISMVGHTGTCLDSPRHRYRDRADLAGLPLARLVELPAIVVRTAGGDVRAVDVGSLAPFDVAGHAVLLHTGGDRLFGTEAYAEDAPFLTAGGARWLVEHGAALVGIDSVDIDDVSDPTRPAHSLLLAADIPVVEHLTGLDQVPPHGARFTAAPPRIAGLGTFPVRAYATVPG